MLEQEARGVVQVVVEPPLGPEGPAEVFELDPERAEVTRVAGVRGRQSLPQIDGAAEAGG